jgi:hypothetical protein
MRKIDKRYAIIYIDDEGESLKHDSDNYVNEQIGDEYYQLPFDKNTEECILQWNCYLIVPTKYFTTPEQLDEFLDNDKYTRKHAIKEEEIDLFIEKMFPDLQEEHGVIELVKGINRSDSVYQAIRKHDELGIEYKLIDSYYRNDSMMDTLYKMDKLRAKLVLEPESKFIFYTHITNEMNLAEKKFKLFINDNS